MTGGVVTSPPGSSVLRRAVGAGVETGAGAVRETAPFGRAAGPTGRGAAVGPWAHLVSLVSVVSAIAARPASRRAAGRRKGEQET